MSYDLASQVPGITEIQAGGYVFMDTGYRQFGIDVDFALTVLSSVASRTNPEKAMVDAGFKVISVEHGTARQRQDGFRMRGPKRGTRPLKITSIQQCLVLWR